MHSPQDKQAQPRSAAAILSLPSRPEILNAVQNRGITQVVHFTTLKGAVGILAARAVKCRSELPEDKYLQYVYQPNALIRKDDDWLDYVNLSIERINDWMFAHSTKWHAAENNPWVVFSFHPRILTHPGVVFTTTNNIYPSCRRAEGLIGFNDMFADTVLGRYGIQHDRTGKSGNWTTDRQAEVLYPGKLSCKHLQRIYAQQDEALDVIYGVLGGLNVDFEVSHSSEVFE